MGFKDLFIVTEKKDVGDTTSAAPTSAPQPVPYIPPVVRTTVSNEDFSLFREQLEESLEAANLPTKQDYMDLRKALVNMNGLQMDEATKYKAAFATLQSVGCDVSEIVDSFNYYGNVVDGEKQKFDEATQSALSDDVLEKQQTVESMTKENVKSATEIKRLTEKTTANQQQITALQTEISAVTSKIDQKKATFEAAYDKVKSEMQADLEKVKLYLGNIAPAPKTKKSTKK
jgi:chromosome segregation ATPase